MTDLPTTPRPSRIPGVEAFRRGRQLMQDAAEHPSIDDDMVVSSFAPSSTAHPLRPRSAVPLPSADGSPNTHSAVGPVFSEHGVALRKIELPQPPPEEIDHGPELPAWVVRTFTATFLIALVGILLTKSPVLV